MLGKRRLPGFDALRVGDIDKLKPCVRDETPVQRCVQEPRLVCDEVNPLGPRPDEDLSLPCGTVMTLMRTTDDGMCAPPDSSARTSPALGALSGAVRPLASAPSPRDPSATAPSPSSHATGPAMRLTATFAVGTSLPPWTSHRPVSEKGPSILVA
jgi:hypothetical protein